MAGQIFFILPAVLANPFEPLVAHQPGNRNPAPVYEKGTEALVFKMEDKARHVFSESIPKPAAHLVDKTVCAYRRFPVRVAVKARVEAYVLR